MVVAGPGLWQHEALFVGGILIVEFFVVVMDSMLRTLICSCNLQCIVHLVMETITLFLVDQIQTILVPHSNLYLFCIFLHGFVQGFFTRSERNEKGHSNRPEAFLLFGSDWGSIS